MLKNMCSVRQRPMPWAPLVRATRASSGVSALVITFRRRAASTQLHAQDERAAGQARWGGQALGR